MKSRPLIITITTLLAIAGCGQESPYPNRQTEDIVEFNISVTSTRVHTDQDFKCAFDDGDKIGVFAVVSGRSLQAEGNYADNRMLSYIDGKWELEGDPIYYPRGEALDFYAYSPYRKDFNPIAFEYDASTSSYDLMTATSQNVSSGAVALNFLHRLSLIEVNVNGGGNNIYINNAVTRTTVNLEAGLQNSDQTKTISMKANGKKSWRIYLPPQAVTSGELFKISAGSNSVSYPISENRFYSEGSAYRYNIASPIVDIDNLPNCYMAKSGGTVTFPVTKAYELWRQQDWSTEKNLSGTCEARLLWSDAQGLIEGITLNEDSQDPSLSTVTVKASNGKSGNAVIALNVGGSCRWAWHIWVSDYDPDNGGKTYTFPDGQEFMDRNLGALSSDAPDETTYGCYYQGARALPFPGPASATASTMRPVFGENDAEVKIKFDNIWGNDQGQSIRRAVKDPLLFITSSGEPYSWITTDSRADKDMAKDFWPSEANPNKTSWDPCPEGWMLPVHVNSASPWSSFPSSYSDMKISEFGHWPFAGRLKFNGSFDSTSGSAMYWCGDATGLKTSALFMNKSEINPNNNYSRGNALPVRCIRIKQ